MNFLIKLKKDLRVKKPKIAIKTEAKDLSFKRFFAKPYKPKTERKIKSKESVAICGVSKSSYAVKTRVKHNGIMIQNMPDDMDEDEIRKLFNEFGRIKGINIHSKKVFVPTPLVIRRGYVNYVLDKEATNAFKKLNKHRIRNCVLNLKILKNKR